MKRETCESNICRLSAVYTVIVRASGVYRVHLLPSYD